MVDLVQNAVEAGSSMIMLDVKSQGSELEMVLSDNGKGMDEATLAQARDPFYTEPGKHAGRRVGLGLPFLVQTAETVNGEADIRSEPGQGTSIWLKLDTAHMDAPPFGEWAPAVVTMMNFQGDYELAVTRERNGQRSRVLKSELIDALGGMADAEALSLAKRYIQGLDEEWADQTNLKN
jgi:hypothetical protein